MELYCYLYELPHLDFSVFFRVGREIIEYIKPQEVSQLYLKNIWSATQRQGADIEVCVLKQDYRKLLAVIDYVRQKKLKALIKKDRTLDLKTLEVFADLSGASQMIIKGGVDGAVAKKAAAATSYMVANLMKNEAAMSTLSRMIAIDPSLYDHSAAVAMFAGLMAIRHKGRTITEKQAALVAQCGLYHDIGKSCVPSYILNKPGSFNREEYEVMKTHAQQGHKELDLARKRGAPIPSVVSRVALEHHERFAGHGYPYGKKGRAEDDPQNGIHLYTRFVSIADAYSALLMERIYKPALSPAKAIELMSEHAEQDFDMVIFREFIAQIKGSLASTKRGGVDERIHHDGITLHYNRSKVV